MQGRIMTSMRPWSVFRRMRPTTQKRKTAKPPARWKIVKNDIVSPEPFFALETTASLLGGFGYPPDLGGGARCRRTSLGGACRRTAVPRSRGKRLKLKMA